MNDDNLTPIDEERTCVICGTILDDTEEIFTELESGPLCVGCYNEGWFKQCQVCGQYEFEDQAHDLEEEDAYLCQQCYSARNKLNEPKPATTANGHPELGNRGTA